MQPLESFADRIKRKSSGASSTGSLSINPDAPSRLLALPLELQFLIFSSLAFGDLERLRRTCHYYRMLLSHEYIRELFEKSEQGGFLGQLTSTCQTCLDAPGRSALVLQPRPPVSRASQSHPHPLHPKNHPTAKCFRCAVQSRDLRVGTTVTLANSGIAWVCRWCGWPVVGPHSWAHEQFHVGCYDRYCRVLWIFMCLGFAQFAVGVVAATLALRYFKGEKVVLGPAVASFILLWICMTFLVLRGNRVRTYHWVGLLELAIVGLWIPPIYAVSKAVQREILGSSVAALAFFAINMIFRLLNFIGNIVLMFEYDLTKRYAPQIPLRGRLMNLLMTGLVYWTYPQCVEQRYPPDFN
ncbi:uncharacterized protein BCR38DRAFT_350055 [Pseudomassariella vexata]|uniref:F-box domain-containing protein n=1 Tax=Pseudomassariella vexata TaxID=1141098 RepID=A0A1Y2DL00_9PEZI|nr:uncharacterized protein BCR38DRAFT_350055 [Pseudomassariella vexata]ORY59968.1 hypothetical protein BCR38DRAFT_350055 [Pseudomassariella vexata]